MADEEARPPLRTPPGLYVIATMFALAGMASFYLLLHGTEAGRTFGQYMTPVCFLIAYGIATKGRITRLVLLVLLVLCLVFEAVLLVVNIGALAGLVHFPPNVNPVKNMVTAPVRVLLTLWMIRYLRREDVRAVFYAPPPAEPSEPGIP